MALALAIANTAVMLWGIGILVVRAMIALGIGLFARSMSKTRWLK